MEVGSIIIGTELDTKKLERQLKDLERENQKIQKKKVELETDDQSIKEFTSFIKDLYDEQLKNAKTEEEIKNTREEYNMLLNLSNTALEKNKKELDEINQKERQNSKEVDKVKRQLGQSKLLDNIGGKIDNVGKSVSNITNKIIRWGIALFGVRSAYNFITSSVATLSQYNEQIGTDVSYIRFALASMLQPVVEGLIKLAYRLLTYINYISYAWFRVNLFANATTEAFEKTNKAVAGTNKSAKELKKTLTGFDEMNILQEDGSVGSGGGGGGITLPSMDLSSLENVEIPKWIDWIAQNKETVLGFFRDLIALITTIKIVVGAMKIASLFLSLSDIFTILSTMSKLEIFGMLAGIGITLVGIFKTVQSLINFIADPTWENFVQVLYGLETVLIGVGIAMVAFNATNPIGWITLAVGAIGGLVTKLFDEEKQAYNTRDAEKALEDARQKMTEATNAYVNAVDQAEQAEKNLQTAQEETGISINELLSWMQTENKEYKDLDENQRKVYKAYLANEGAQKKVKDASEEVAKANIEETKRNIENQLALAKASGEYTNFKNAVFDAMKKNQISTEEASKYMTDAMKGMSNQAKRTFLNDIPEDIKQAFDTTKFGQAWRNFEYWWNRQINNLDTTIDLQIRGEGLYSIQPTGPYNFGRAKGGLFYPSKLPKLAVGGIINRPGAGVPYHGATIGERGAEAVVPLTDSQQMAILGEMIGKYITVNANIVNTMNGRVISRELQQIRNNEDFAYNR